MFGKADGDSFMSSPKISIEEAELLLPFYVNGSLNEDETEQVKLTLTVSERLQKEVIFLQSLQYQVQQNKYEKPSSELAFKRLQQEINKEKAIALKQQQASLSSSKYRWQVATVAACLLLAVQAVNDIDKTVDYNAASGSDKTSYQGKTIDVTFSPNVTELQIRELLISQRILIIGGPSALGIYKLAITNNQEATIQKLKEHKDLIDSIQE